MRQFHQDGFRNVRPLVVAAVVIAAMATSGCHWFKRGNPYSQSAQTRPLEVPPDLDKPNTEAAMQAPAAPQSVTRSSMATAPASQAQASASGFTVAGERDDVFNKVGSALASTEGVTIASKAQLLGSYDVNYAGSNFLVRVTKVDAGVYVSAVDPRGMPATNDAATKLIAALKTAIGG
jgi:uncharacterized lipoprotein